MLAQDLPYDIWEHTATFLSSEDTKKLLTVNRTLFTIAMNERYRTTTIGSLMHTNTRRNIARLVDPEVASRVRKLIFKPGHICHMVLLDDAKKNSVTEIKPNITSKIRKIVKHSISEKRMESPNVVPGHIPVGAAVEDVLSIMGLIKELRSLVIDIATMEHWYYQKAAIPFFTIGWSTFRTSLQSLELRLPVDDLALILPDLSQGIFPNLETVFLWIIRASLGTQMDVIMIETILPFLQSHHRTLRSLSLDLAERISLSPLLLQLHLPSLTHFNLVLPYFSQGETEYMGIQHFFKTHRSKLTHLEITIGGKFALYADSQTPTYPIFSQECFATRLPRLEHLAIDHSFSDAYNGGVLRDSVISYIHQFKSTLVSLKLGSRQSWILDSVKILAEGFLSSAKLRRLEISVVFFEPDLLALLAANLPNLEVLDITMLSVSPRGFAEVYARHIRVPTFSVEIRAKYFPQWRLRSLNLQVYGSGPSAIEAVDYLDDSSSKSALLEALPNVRTFCGLGREEYYLS